MRWSVLGGALAVVLLSLAAAAPARAQDDDTARARSAFQRGVERFADGDYEAALESFQEAYRLRPHPAVRVNMANCYERLGRPVEALFHYERFLSEAPPDLLQGRQAEVRRAIAGLERQVGQLALTVTPSSARVRIDGEAVQLGEMPIRLIAGEHRLDVAADGYRTHGESFQAVAGERTSITVELRRGPAGGSTAGSGAGTTRPDRAGGTGRSTARAGTGSARGAGAAAAGGGGGSEEPELGDTGGGGSRFLSTPVLVSGGAAVALFLGGTITGVMALGAESDFDAAAMRIERGDYANDAELARLQSQGQDDADSATTLALASDILLISSLVAGGFAVYFIVTYDEDDASSSTRASASLRALPLATPDSAGLVLHGTF